MNRWMKSIRFAFFWVIEIGNFVVFSLWCYS